MSQTNRGFNDRYINSSTRNLINPAITFTHAVFYNDLNSTPLIGINGGGGFVSNNNTAPWIYEISNFSIQTAAVPEPTSLAVFAIGACVAGLGARRRRREKQQVATA